MSLPNLDRFDVAVLMRPPYQSSSSSLIFDTRTASSFDLTVISISSLLIEPAIIQFARPSALAAQCGAGFGFTGETGIAARFLARDGLKPCLLLLTRGAFVIA